MAVVWSDAPAADAHLLVRREVARVRGGAEREVVLGHHCPRCGSDRHGRLLVAGRPGEQPLGAAVARTAGMVVVALSVAGPVGVDVERLDAARFAGVDRLLDKVVLAGNDPASDRVAVAWVRREALLKAAGHGLALPPEQIGIEEHDGRPVVTAWPRTGGPLPSLWLVDLPLGSRVRASVAGVGDSAPGVSVRPAGPAAPAR